MAETRYIVRGKTAKDADNLYIKAGDVVWLDYTREGGGWYQWTSQYAIDHLGTVPFMFADRDTALRAAVDCPGPWYHQPAKDSIEVLEVDYTPARAASWRIREQSHAQS